VPCHYDEPDDASRSGVNEDGSKASAYYPDYGDRHCTDFEALLAMILGLLLLGFLILVCELFSSLVVPLQSVTLTVRV
jgi:hypothetical protein